MATEVTITTDASGNAVKFRSTGREDLPKSAGKAVTTDKTAGTHGQVNPGGNIPGPVFDNPA